MKMNINNLCDGLRSAPPPALSVLALPIDIARPSNPFSFFAKPRSIQLVGRKFPMRLKTITMDPLINNSL